MDIDPADRIILTKRDEGASKDPTGLTVMLVPLLLVSGVAFCAVVVGAPALLSDAKFRWLLSVYFIFWGLAYYLTSETAMRFYIGLIEIIGGIWNNWYQLGTFAAPGTQTSKSDRLIFIAGGIALMANGIKDTVKGRKKMKAQNNRVKTGA